MLSDLQARLSRCTLEDRAALGRRARRLRACAAETGADPRWARLERDLQRSEALYQRRRDSVPPVSVPDHLPIAAHREAIVAAIREHPVVIVSGDTGCGKSTQLPKLCLLAGRGVAGQIAHTQPRRVAARGVARRLAQELGQPLGQSVGFKVRFDAKVRRESHVKVLTDGMLLAELARDRQLSAYDTVIVDEAHERSLNVDFLLGYLKRLCARRPELRVIVSSATLDEARFAQFFDDAPVLQVAGRSYPVEIRYRAPPGEQPLAEQVRQAVAELIAEGPGDVLVFLSGEREIHDTAGRLKAAFGATVEILPLYARLPLARQDRVFAPHAVRRVVLATNVAETSLTVPGVRYVVDAGQARVSRYSPGSAVQRLPVEPISKASARQRAGRCGREGPGICIRLYDEAAYEGFADHGEPEIRRTDLAAVLLSMLALGVKDLATFPFMDPPARRHVNDGLRLLRELGALDEHGGLTAVGRQLARLPLDPRVGRMLLAAGEHDCVAEILIIAAGLACGDPRERERGQRGPAPQHLRFEDERSDFLRLVKIWQHVQAHTRGARAQSLAELCRRRRLSLTRMLEWREVHLQLSVAAREMGLHPRPRAASYARVHRAMLTGLLRHVGVRRGERDYQGIRGNAFRISRGSGQSERRPRWVLAAEVVDAGSAFAHTVAGVRAEWVERAGGPLIRRSHFDAWWDAERGEAMVHEQTALYAITVTQRRAVRFAPVSPSGAREVFIRGALLEGRLHSQAPFLQANRAHVRARRALEARLRRPDPAISEERLFAFYHEHIPAQVCDTAGFERWWRQAPASTLQGLDLARWGQWGTSVPEQEGLAERFPDRLDTAGASLCLEYRFAPGEEDDGITVVVPRELLGTLDPAALEWSVPGLLQERVVALLRALPKAMRRRIPPPPDTAREFLAVDRRGQGTVSGTLARFLSTRYGVEVEPDAWSGTAVQARLEPHLRLRYRVVGDDGDRVAEGRDLERMQRRHGAGARPRREAPASLHTRWDFGPLPLRQEVTRAGARGVLYPALLAHPQGVSVARVEDAARAVAVHAGGLVRLVLCAEGLEPERLARQVPQGEHLCLLNTRVPAHPLGEGEGAHEAGPCARLLRELAEAAVARAFLDGEGWQVRDAAAFAALCARGRPRLQDALAQESAQAMGILELHRELRLRLDEEWPAAWAPNLDDLREQLAWLVYQGYVAATPEPRRVALARYLEAARLRLDKLRRGGARDSEKLALVRPVWERFVVRARAHARRGRRDAALEQYRWLVEEYRISLFAQELRAAERVSRQRLDRQWESVPP